MHAGIKVGIMLATAFAIYSLSPYLITTCVIPLPFRILHIAGKLIEYTNITKQIWYSRHDGAQLKPLLDDMRED